MCPQVPVVPGTGTKVTAGQSLQRAVTCYRSATVASIA